MEAKSHALLIYVNIGSEMSFSIICIINAWTINVSNEPLMCWEGVESNPNIIVWHDKSGWYHVLLKVMCFAKEHDRDMHNWKTEFGPRSWSRAWSHINTWSSACGRACLDPLVECFIGCLCLPSLSSTGWSWWINRRGPCAQMSAQGHMHGQSRQWWLRRVFSFFFLVPTKGRCFDLGTLVGTRVD